MDVFSDEITSKNTHKFICVDCDFKCCKKGDWNRHILTPKHIKHTISDACDTACDKKNIYACTFCRKTYKSRNGLWVHKKKCNSIHDSSSDDEDDDDDNKQSKLDDEPTDKQILKMIVENQNGLQNMIMEILKQGVNSHNTNTNTNHTNSHNKSFNLQFFLNETCKNAMNITDFVKSIEIELDDLEQVGELGYVEGITNIINKNLNKLDITQRPLHCTDKKREVLYIKDDDKWEKEDDNNPKLRKAVKVVSNKNARKLVAFKDKYPDCIYSYSNKSDQYNKLVVEAMGGHNSNDFIEEGKIIKNIIKNVAINKDKYIAE